MKRWRWDYNYGPNLKEDNIGDWVKYEDVARLKELNREMLEVIKHIRGLRLQKYQEFHRDRDVLSVLDDAIAKAEGEG